MATIRTASKRALAAAGVVGLVALAGAPLTPQGRQAYRALDLRLGLTAAGREARFAALLHQARAEFPQADTGPLPASYPSKDRLLGHREAVLAEVRAALRSLYPRLSRRGKLVAIAYLRAEWGPEAPDWRELLQGETDPAVRQQILYEMKDIPALMAALDRDGAFPENSFWQYWDFSLGYLRRDPAYFERRMRSSPAPSPSGMRPMSW